MFLKEFALWEKDRILNFFFLFKTHVFQGVCIVGKRQNPELFFLFKTHVSQGVCIVGKRENPELFFLFKTHVSQGSQKKKKKHILSLNSLPHNPKF